MPETPSHVYLMPATNALARAQIRALGLGSLDTLVSRLLQMQAALMQSDHGRRILRKYHLEGIEE